MKLKKMFFVLMATLLWLLIVVPVYAQGKEYSVKYGSKELYGILSKPNAAADKRQGIVILAHGFGGTHHFAYAYFDALNKLGYQAYAFDFAGGSPMSRSDKNTMNMSVLDQQRQLETVVEHFRSQPDIDPKRIVLLGESQGGLVSALTAASIQKKINRLVLIFPAFCIPYHWRARYPAMEQVPDTTRLWNVPLSRQYFREIHDMDAFALARKYRKPVLIVHGDADNVVPYADSEKMVKLYKKAILKCIPGAGHGFNPEQQARNLSYIIPFLQENM